MIARSVPEIHCTRGFCDGRGGGIGYSSSWMGWHIVVSWQFDVYWVDKCESTTAVLCPIWFGNAQWRKVAESHIAVRWCPIWEHHLRPIAPPVNYTGTPSDTSSPLPRSSASGQYTLPGRTKRRQCNAKSFYVMPILIRHFPWQRSRLRMIKANGRLKRGIVFL